MRIHTITTSFVTYVRLALLALLSLLIVLAVPFLGESLVDFLVTHTFNLGILYAIIVGFVMSIVMTRRQALEDNVHLELNKIRRIYHLVLHMKKADPALAPWYEDVRIALRAYLVHFKDTSFHAYAKGDKLFRRVTYTLYGLPVRAKAYNSDLYGAVIDAAASATEAREAVRAVLGQAIGRFQWFALLLVTLSFCLSFAALTPASTVERILSTTFIFTLFFVLDMLYEYDWPNEKMQDYLANLYIHDLDDAEGFLEKSGRKK